jgi:hypothetical protein
MSCQNTDLIVCGSNKASTEITPRLGSRIEIFSGDFDQTLLKNQRLQSREYIDTFSAPFEVLDALQLYVIYTHWNFTSHEIFYLFLPDDRKPWPNRFSLDWWFLDG